MTAESTSPALVVKTREDLNLLVDVLPGFTADQRDLIKKLVRSGWTIGADTGLAVGLSLGAKVKGKPRPKGLAAKSRAERSQILMRVEAVLIAMHRQGWKGPQVVKAMRACGLTKAEAEEVRGWPVFRLRAFAEKLRGRNKRPQRSAR